VRSGGELPSQSLDEIEAFFVAYNRGEGREFEILARKGPRAAERLLDSAVRAFRAKHRRKRAS
jgi:hypothetical protein